MKHVLSILMIIFYSLTTNTFCAERPMPLKVNTMKRDLTLYITSKTTIKELKEMIEDSEGIAVDQQRLTKSEGLAFQPQWSFVVPFKRLIITLENGQTCRQYDLQSEQRIYLSIKLPKSLAQIEAELQARREAITAALLQKRFQQPLVALVTAYDTTNED